MLCFAVIIRQPLQAVELRSYWIKNRLFNSLSAGVSISMVTPNITVNEDVGFVQVCFMLSRQSAIPIDVRLDGQSGTAIGNLTFIIARSYNFMYTV